MSFTSDEIKRHYKSEAERYGLAGTSTIQDPRTRELERNALFSYVRDQARILEVGCGNGYVAEELVKRFDVDLDAVDFSSDMITLASLRSLKGARGRVSFFTADILVYQKTAVYDLVFTERCLQNLASWEDQKKALSNIAASVKPGGSFLMLESFWTGMNKMNAARAELDLPKIDPVWHNVFFDEAQTIAFLESRGLCYVDQNCFLSGYYFGSRVVLPAISPKDRAVKFSSILNDYFCHWPPHDDFSPIKILRFMRS